MNSFSPAPSALGADVIANLPRLIAAKLGQKIVYKPKDAAQIAGVDDDTVTRFLRTRADFFPAKRILNGKTMRKHEWVIGDFLKALIALADLSPTALRILTVRAGALGALVLLAGAAS